MSKQALNEEMISRLHDWFEIPTKPALYRAIAVWLAEVKAEAWQEGAATVYQDNDLIGGIIPANPYRQGGEHV